MPAALALANVACTSDPKRFFNPPGKPNESYQNLTFGAGDGSLTYDTNGIPVPPPGVFGKMLNEIIRLIIQPIPGSYEYVYDPTPRAANPVAPNGTIRIYARSNGAELSGAVGVTVLPVTAIGQ